MKWFIQDKKIHGPYSDNEVAEIILNRTEPTFVWARGLEEWLVAEKWSPHLIQQKPISVSKPSAVSAQATQVASKPSPIQNNTQKPVQTATVTSAMTSATPSQPNTTSHDATQIGPAITTHNPAKGTETTQVEKTHISIPKNAKFKVQYDFIDQGEMTIEQLIEFTSRQKDHSKIAVFDVKDREWKEIYTIPEVVRRFGITRRKHARVPIMAQFSGESSSGEQVNSRVVTISVGGMGLSDNFNLTIGQTVRGQITSPHFFSPISVDAEVTYSGQDGYIGLKFTHLGDDAVSLITEYVNKFGHKK